MKEKRAIRWVYSLGFLVIGVSALRAAVHPVPEWFASAVYQAALALIVSTGLVWAMSELTGRFFPRRGVLWGLFLVAVAAVVPSSIYLGGASFYGQSQAEFDTWHLLPLFAVMHQVKAVVFAALLVAALGLVVIMVRFARRRVPNKALQATCETHAPER